MAYFYFTALYNDYTYADRMAAAEAEIGTIHLAQRDADGTNLPPIPDTILNNSTVAGIDANANHIRDDVELAMFEKYPIIGAVPATKETDTNFALRAASLQYAQAMQVMLTLVDNKQKMSVAAESYGAAYGCLNLQDDLVRGYDALYILNTEERRAHLSLIYERYGGSSGTRAGQDCDI